MVPYKLKMMHFEYDILNLYYISHNRTDYPKEDINSGDASSMVLIYDMNLCDTTITDNTDLSSNNISEIRH